MNPTIAQLQNRRSIRQFTGERVSDADLELIFKTAQRAPTSINGQQISLVYTKDKDKIKKIAELCGGQPQIATADVFVAIIIDFNRTAKAVELAGKEHVIEHSAEGIMVGAIDAGIMLSSLQTAAEALGYGTTAIGAVRANPEAMIELFNLPPKTFVAVGSTIGVPTEAAKNAPLKPRISLDSFAMKETYDNARVLDAVEPYNDAMRTFRDATGSGDMPTYVELTANYYSSVYFPKTGTTLEAQGFEFA